MANTQDNIKMLVSGVERNFKNRVLSKVYDYGDSYLMVLDATDKKDEDDYVVDAFYLVNKKTFDLEAFTPVADLKKFKAVVAKEPIYDRSKEE